MTTHDEFESLAAIDALGALSADEQRELQSHVASCDSCRRAHDEFQEAAASFGSSLEPVAPPVEVRESIMEAVTEETTDEVIEIERKRFDATRWWLATAATIFFALWGWRELTIRAERENRATREAEIQTLTAENALIKQRNEKLNSEIISLASSGSRTIALTGQAMAPAATARVFIESDKRRAVVLFANLPSNPNDTSYQLWIIGADQSKPVGAGIFDVGSNGTAAMTVENLPPDTDIKVMAVTLEPKGGVDQPTNSNYYVMGKS